MRTTVTLDPDVEASLKKHMRARDISFKEAVNTAIRAGLSMSTAPATPYRQQTFAMGLRSEVSLVKALALASDLEDEAILSKLELRK